MGTYAPANVTTSIATADGALPYLNHLGATFTPSTTAFADGFAASVQSWAFIDPNTDECLAIVVSAGTWRSRLQSLGATKTEPIWRFCNCHFNQLLVADSQGNRDNIVNTDALYLLRRTRAVVSSETFTFTTNTAGKVRIRVDPAPFIFTTPAPIKTGSLADVTIEADGVLTPTQLATAAANALLAVPGFAALYDATPTVGAVLVESLVEGYPLIIQIDVTTGGPTMTQVRNTANVAGDYALDLDDLHRVVELGESPSRKYFWLTDTQLDDVVSLEGMQWVYDQEQDEDPPNDDYLFIAQSTTGDKPVKFGANFIGNFYSAATDALSQAAQEANVGEGFENAAVADHPLFEFVVAGIMGRMLGYLPGDVSGTAKVLFGSTADSRMTPRAYADDDLASAENRSFSWYAAFGPRGNFQYAGTPARSFFDRVWLKYYATYQSRTDLVAWMQLKNIVTYTNDDILGGKAIIAQALAKLPAVTAPTIRVTFLSRGQVDPADISARVYSYYATFADSNGVINQIGTLTDPITIVIKDAG